MKTIINSGGTFENFGVTPVINKLENSFKNTYNRSMDYRKKLNEMKVPELRETAGKLKIPGQAELKKVSITI